MSVLILNTYFRPSVCSRAGALVLLSTTTNQFRAPANESYLHPYRDASGLKRVYPLPSLVQQNELIFVMISSFMKS
jgi:hypothetical protein